MKFIKYIFTSCLLVVLLFCFSLVTHAQKRTVKSNSAINIASKDTTKKPTDSLSLKSKSSNGLDAAAKYSADDSIKYDKAHNIVYLYGNGRIIYDDFELDAEYIKLDQTNNTVFAAGRVNSKTNKYKGKPIFKQGTDKPITVDSLLFNYKSKKGKSFGVFTDVEQGYLHAAQFKKNQYDEGFFKNGIYSTCNLPHPHFGIRITRGMVTEKQIISGPAYLEIEDVPLPAGIPFGFFPKTSKRASGVMLPSFGEDGSLGFVMRDLGYYIGLNDYWDMLVKGSLYSRGSYLVSDLLNYTKNYKYRGQMTFTYSSTKSPTGIEGTYTNKPRKDFRIQWTHSQDPAANPGTNFSASVNAGTSTAILNQRGGGTYDRSQLTQSTLSSSISYTKDLGLFRFESSLRHDQDLYNHTLRLNLPQFSLSMNQALYPFDSKKSVGDKKWYQKLSIGPYTLTGENNINTIDSLLFKKQSLKQFQNGLKHTIPINLSLTPFKFLQVSTSVPYTEIWHFQTIRQRRGPVPNGVGPVVDTLSGFSRSYEYSLSSSLSTKFYGMKSFKKSKIMAIRHVATPSIGMSFRPDFGDPKYGYYRYETDNLGNPIIDPTRDTRYSIYQGILYGGPSPGRQASLTFGLDNNVEAKVRSSKDSVNNFVKVPILQGLRFSSSYNFAADSFKLAPINFSGNTAFFKNKLNLSFGGTFDPYLYNRVLRRSVNQFSISQGKIARLTSFYLSTNFSFNSESVKSKKDKADKEGQDLNNATPAQKEALRQISRNPSDFVDFNVPWNISGSYSFSYSNQGAQSSVQNTVNFDGDFSVTPKWKVRFGSGLDLTKFKFQIPQFNIMRDLHCWDLSFQWTPIGPAKSYFVNLRVKATILQDLKLSKRSINNYNY